MPHTNVRTLNCFTNLAGNQALFGFTHSHFINIPESSHSILANCTCACLCVYAFTKRLFISLVRCVAMLCSIMCLETKMQRFALSFKCCHTEKKNQTQQSGTCSYHPFYGPPPSFCYFFHIRNQKYV